MNNRQMIAYFNPCRFATDAENKIYRQDIIVGGLRLRTVLTVKISGGAASWAASGIVIGKNLKPVPIFTRLSLEQRKLVISAVKELIAGVGEGEFSTRNAIDKIHFERNLSKEEIAGLKRKAA